MTKHSADKPELDLTASRWRARAIVPAALVLMLTVVVFGRVVGFELLRWDDWYMIGENPRLVQPTGEHLLAFWEETDTGYKELYTPLTYSVMWGVAKAWGVRPGVFHGLNLFVHVVNVGLVMALAWQLLPPVLGSGRKGLIAAIAGAVFAVHPAQVEAVAWASSLNTLLAGCFGLLAVNAWVMMRKRTVLRFVLTAAMVALACLCKPSAVALPLVIGAMELLVLRGGWVRSGAAVVVMGLVALPFALIATSIQQAGDVVSPILWRPIVVLDTLGFYGAHLLVPLRILSDYGRTPEFVAEHWLSQPYWVCGLLLVVLGVVAWKRWPMLTGALVLFVVALLPVLGTTAFQFQSYSTVADRYLYLPLAVALPVGVVVLSELRGGVLGAGLAGMAVSTSVVSAAVLPMWRDTLTWADTLMQREPQSPMGYFVLAERSSRMGDEAEAERLYLKCLELRPRSIIYLYDLGNVRMRQQRYGEALDVYLRAMDVGAQTLGVYNNAFVAAQKSGRLGELGVALARVLERDPGYGPAHAYYGWLLLMNGRVGEAQMQFQTALELAPGLPAAEQGMQRIGAMRQ